MNMAFGDCKDDKALQDAWNLFCDRLKEAGSLVFKDYNPPFPLHRADGFRFLTQNLGQAFDLALETKDTKYPFLHIFTTHMMKLGADAADFTYQQAWLDGSSVYKITGNRGSSRFLNFTIQGPRSAAAYGPNAPRALHEPFGDTPEANMFGQQLITEWDGSFELYIGGEKQGKNWLPTTPGTRKLFLRQGYDDWNEVPATMQIERVGMTDPKPVPTPADMIEAMDWAGGKFLLQMMKDWPDLSIAGGGASMKTPNAFPPQVESEADKKRGRAVAGMYWQLKEDEALIIEFDSHNGFWMLCNMGSFRTSMDYLYRPTSYTTSRTKIDKDGKIRIVLTHDDPGYFNWMDTQKFVEGHIVYRSLQNTNTTTFSTKLVKRAQLDAAMPADSVRVTKEERTALMHVRFNSIRRRYAML
jgi:hypothetical protein